MLNVSWMAISAILLVPGHLVAICVQYKYVNLEVLESECFNLFFFYCSFYFILIFLHNLFGIAVSGCFHILTTTCSMLVSFHIKCWWLFDLIIFWPAFRLVWLVNVRKPVAWVVSRSNIITYHMYISLNYDHIDNFLFKWTFLPVMFILQAWKARMLFRKIQLPKHHKETMISIQINKKSNLTKHM